MLLTRFAVRRSDCKGIQFFFDYKSITILEHDILDH